MNILFLFSRHSENEKDSTLTKDLSDEFHRQGHRVTVVTLLEKKYKRETELKIENGYKVLRVRTGNYFDSPGKIEKGVTVLTLRFSLEKAIKENFSKEKIDLIFTHTPFMANPKLIKNLKKYFNCKACLHLWDIFPQNAKDIELIQNKFLIKLFEKKEEKMYQAFDYIGCMSKGNLEYMKLRDKYYSADKYFILKNWAILKELPIIEKEKIRKKYGYSNEDFIAIFGGNMGKPQKLENIVELANRAQDTEFLFVGKGTESNKIKRMVKERNLKNVKFLEYIPREDYEVLTGACDVGLVSLDERFSVPNFPSKTTDYFKLKLPILASLDNCAASDYGIFLQEEVKAGLYSIAGNTESLYENLKKLKENFEFREILGENGRRYYEKSLGVELAYKTIINKISEQGEKNV